MGYTVTGLKEKILELHPEIAKQGFNLTLAPAAEKEGYNLTFKKSGQEFGGFLPKADADACMDGRQCVNLAVLVTQLLAEFQDILTPRKPG